MNNFNKINIIEPIMSYYKDFNYLTYILNLPFDDGFNLYVKTLLNIKHDLEEKREDRYFKLWIIEQEKETTNFNFQEYLEDKLKISENKNLGVKFRESEEERIVNKFKNKKNVKLKRVM